MSDNQQESPTATTILAEAAAVAAKFFVDASVTAQQVVATAAEVALKERDRQDSERDKMKDTLVDALNQVFGEKQEQQQFINLARVPFICAQISEIHRRLGEIALALESLSIVKKIVFGMAGLMMTGILVALLTLVLRK